MVPGFEPVFDEKSPGNTGLGQIGLRGYDRNVRLLGEIMKYLQIILAISIFFAGAVNAKEIQDKSRNRSIPVEISLSK
jgi:hypothetical protein